MRYKVRSGRWYQATIMLTGLTRMASNGQVASRLAGVGFRSVTVTGTGRTRVARGQWAGADAVVEVPKQVTAIKTL